MKQFEHHGRQLTFVTVAVPTTWNHYSISHQVFTQSTLKFFGNLRLLWFHIFENGHKWWQLLLAFLVCLPAMKNRDQHPATRNKTMPQLLVKKK
jgi:hypothetical protein